ncbi:TPA: hypothetical protein ACGFBK_004526 [Escherichia coli]
MSCLPCVQGDDADSPVPTVAVAQGGLVLSSAVGGTVALLSVLANLSVFNAQARVDRGGVVGYSLHIVYLIWVGLRAGSLTRASPGWGCGG